MIPPIAIITNIEITRMLNESRDVMLIASIGLAIMAVMFGRNSADNKK